MYEYVLEKSGKPYPLVLKLKRTPFRNCEVTIYDIKIRNHRMSVDMEVTKNEKKSENHKEEFHSELTLVINDILKNAIDELAKKKDKK